MRQDAVDNKQEIIKAAWRLFSVQGTQVSLRAVATEAGVGIATLYRHFANREELLMGVVQEVQQRVSHIALSCSARWQENPLVQWEKFVHDIAALRLGAIIGNLAPIAAHLNSFEQETAQIRSSTLAAIDSILDLARVESFVAEGLDARKFFSALAIMSRPLPEPAEQMLPEDLEWMVTVLIRGLKVQKEVFKDELK